MGFKGTYKQSKEATVKDGKVYLDGVELKGLSVLPESVYEHEGVQYVEIQLEMKYSGHWGHRGDYWNPPDDDEIEIYDVICGGTDVTEFLSEKIVSNLEENILVHQGDLEDEYCEPEEVWER